MARRERIFAAIGPRTPYRDFERVCKHSGENLRPHKVRANGGNLETAREATRGVRRDGHAGVDVAPAETRSGFEHPIERRRRREVRGNSAVLIPDSETCRPSDAQHNGGFERREPPDITAQVSEQ